MRSDIELIRSELNKSFPEYRVTSIVAEVAKNIKELYPPQRQAIEKGILTSDENFIIATETSTGKSLLAVLRSLVTLKRKSGLILYLCPLNSLLQQKFEDIQKWAHLGLNPLLLSDKSHKKDEIGSEFNFLLCTPHSLDERTKRKAEWIKNVSLIIIDEIHIIGSKFFGPFLEASITRFRNTNPDSEILALSATIPNPNDFAEWFKDDKDRIAKIVHDSEFRPKLIKTHFERSDNKKLYVKNFVLNKIVSGDKQALIFSTTKPNVKSCATSCVEGIEKSGLALDTDSLEKVINEFIRADPEFTKDTFEHAEKLRYGVGIITGDVPNDQRNIIMQAFDNGYIKVICTTTALAYGINTPADIVLIRDYLFPNPQTRKLDLSMSVFDYFQIKGRAGRYSEGECYMLASTEVEKSNIALRYQKQNIEKLKSCFIENNDIQRFLLSEICINEDTLEESLLIFWNSTFLGAQNPNIMVHKFDQCIKYLRDNELILQDKAGNLTATDFGYIVYSGGVYPESGVLIRDELSKVKGELSNFDLIYLACLTSEIEHFEGKVDETIIARALSKNFEPSIYPYGAPVALYRWVSEESLDVIQERMAISPASVNRMKDAAQNLMKIIYKIDKEIIGKNVAGKRSLLLNHRLIYGVKEDKIPLLKIIKP